MANCDWLLPLDQSQANNPFKKLDLLTLDPSRAETLTLVRAILSEVLDIFPDEFVHVGGDEIDFRCWTTHPQIRQWLGNSSLTPKAALQQFYRDTVFQVGPLSQSSSSLSLYGIFWSGLASQDTCTASKSEYDCLARYSNNTGGGQ